MSLPVSDTHLDRDLARFRLRVRGWVDANLYHDEADETDEEGEARRLLRLLAKPGWLRYAVPKAHGGKTEAVESRWLCVLREEIARGSGFADTMLALQGLGSYPIAIAGKAAHRRRWLPKVASGDAVAAFAITEPEAGSDVASMTCRARRRGERYLIHGLKCFISNAGIASFYTLFATTNPRKGKDGISAFVVPADTPGIDIRERTRLIASHPIGVLEFRGCAVPRSALLGREGDGLKIALATLGVFRPTVGAAAVGLAQRALEEATAWAHERRQFGRRLEEFQATQFRLAEMATDVQASRLLVHDAARALRDATPGAAAASSMAKLHATEAAQRVIDGAVQLFGGRGVVSGAVVERLYREVRALRIYEGTSEIQKLIIARALRKAADGR